MTAAAPDGGLAARAHPLMMLGTLAPARGTEPDITVRLVSPSDPDLDRIWAVPAVLRASRDGGGAGRDDRPGQDRC